MKHITDRSSRNLSYSTTSSNLCTCIYLAALFTERGCGVLSGGVFIYRLRVLDNQVTKSKPSFNKPYSFVLKWRYCVVQAAVRSNRPEAMNNVMRNTEGKT